MVWGRMHCRRRLPGKHMRQKGRPSDNPLIVHIADYEDLKKIAVNIPPETDMLAAHSGRDH